VAADEGPEQEEEDEGQLTAFEREQRERKREMQQLEDELVAERCVEGLPAPPPPCVCGPATHAATGLRTRAQSRRPPRSC
jgi:hypothetical protein